MLREIPAVVTRATPTSTPTATESGTDAQGLYYDPPPQRLSSGSLSHFQGTQTEVSLSTNIGNTDVPHPQPNAEGAQRKRKREPDPFRTLLGSSKRRIEVIEAATPNIQRRGVGMTQSGDTTFFQNAHNLVFKDSNMVGAQHVYMEHRNRSPDVLLWLKEYTMTGAEYDSSVRNPPPRCHPGTRTTIIRKVFDWLMNPQREKGLFWLRGPAGVGKSAIVQTLAENLSKTQHLGASLFFSRRRGRTNPSHILPTLAYRFAVQDPSYRAYITEAMLADPKMLEKAMSEQFDILIGEPFASGKVRSGQEIWVVALDGLDECGEDPDCERHSDRVQCDIVRLISSFTRKCPTVPLMWIIASRPETHLKAVFSEADVLPGLWEEEIPADSTEACKDVEQFLHWEFMRIRQNYPDHIHKSPWPARDQLLKIANTALGLFISAEVIVRFIDDPLIGNPIWQLERVLSAISKVPTSKQENPLAVLDAVYISILSKIPSDMLQATKRLIGSFICLESHHIGLPDCDLRQTCNYLEITRGTAVTALRYLHSVIYFHKVEDIGQTRPRFYHAAFKDFLEDPSRSHEYFIDRKEVVVELFQGIIRTAQAQFPSKPTPLPSWSDDEHTEPPGSFITDCLHSVFKGVMSSDGVYTTFHDMRCFLSDAQSQLLPENPSVIKLLQHSLETVGLLVDIPRLSTSNPREATLRELRQRGFLIWTTLDLWALIGKLSRCLWRVLIVGYTSFM